MSFSLLLALFLVITPIFGKSIDYRESIVLYAAIILFFLFSRFRRSPSLILHKKFILFEIILILLYIVSTIFSKNISFSYYGLIRFLFTLTLLNLSLTNVKDALLSKLIHYSSLIYALVFLLNKFNLIQLLPRPFYDNFILQIWGHSYLADIIIMAIPIVIYQLIYQIHSGLKNKLFQFFSLLLLLSTLILTNSRSGAISLAIGSAYLLIPKIKNIFKPLVLLLAIFLIAYFTNQFLYLQESTLKSPGGNRLEYWKQALNGFTESPILGNGPNNFFYINKKYQSQANSNTNYAHNYFLESLALNGLPYTLIFFAFVLLSLKYQLHRHPLNFSIGLIALINTLLDPAWNSLGIFCLSLFYIFNQNPLVVVPTSKSSPKKLFTTFSFVIFAIICLFYLTKTAADILYIRGQKLTSLRLDPFNLDNSLSLDPKFLDFTIFLNSHNIFLFREMTRIIPLPQSETYYYQLFSLSPKENLAQYTQLATFYLQTKQQDKLTSLLSSINKNITPTIYPIEETISIAKIYYQVALLQWDKHDFTAAIDNFKNAVVFSKGWGEFQIELANAYWSYGQKDLATNQLQVECQEIPLSSQSCQNFLNSNQFSQPGIKQYNIKLIDPGFFPLSDANAQLLTYYRQEIANNTLPKNENYFYKIFEIDPRRNLDLYTQLANYYLTEKQFDKLAQILSLTSYNINTETHSTAPMHETLPIAKIFYHFALIKFEVKQYDEALYYFKEAVRFSRDWIDFQIEYANALFSIGQKDQALIQLKTECQKDWVYNNYCNLFFKQFNDNLPLPGRPAMLQKIDNLTPYYSYDSTKSSQF
jgi:O-antigen ligase